MIKIRMKKSVLTLLMVLGTVILVEAQQKLPTATEMATKSIEALDKKVKLNPTQKNVIYNYMVDMCKDQLDLSKKQQAGTAGEDDITRFYKSQNATNASIRNILKGDQQAQYDEFLEEQARGGQKKKKKGKHDKEDEEVVTGISGLKLPNN